jgi:hypothetical protein
MRAVFKLYVGLKQALVEPPASLGFTYAIVLVSWRDDLRGA